MVGEASLRAERERVALLKGTTACRRERGRSNACALAGRAPGTPPHCRSEYERSPTGGVSLSGLRFGEIPLDLDISVSRHNDAALLRSRELGTGSRASRHATSLGHGSSAPRCPIPQISIGATRRCTGNLRVFGRRTLMTAGPHRGVAKLSTGPRTRWHGSRRNVQASRELSFLAARQVPSLIPRGAACHEPPVVPVSQ